MQKESEVAIFLGRNTETIKTAVLIMIRIKAITPRLIRKRWIGANVVKSFESTVLSEKWSRKRSLTFFNFGLWLAMKPHVESCESSGSVIKLLPVDSNLLSFLGDFQKKRTGTAGRIVDSVHAGVGFVGFNNFGHDARDFGRSIKLAFAFTRFNGKMLHQIFVSITQKVIAFGTILTKV